MVTNEHVGLLGSSVDQMHKCQCEDSAIAKGIKVSQLGPPSRSFPSTIFQGKVCKTVLLVIKFMQESQSVARKNASFVGG